MYASTGASQYSQRAMGDVGMPGSTWFAPIVPAKMGVTRVHGADLGRGSGDERNQCLWIFGRVQLVAQLPGADYIQGAGVAHRADQVAHKTQVLAPPGGGEERQEQLLVVVQPAGGIAGLARHGAMVVYQRHDQLHAAGAQHGRETHDLRTDLLPVHGRTLLLSVAKARMAPPPKPVRVAHVLLEIVRGVVKQQPVHVGDERMSAQRGSRRALRRAITHADRHEGCQQCAQHHTTANAHDPHRLPIVADPARLRQAKGRASVH